MFEDVERVLISEEEIQQKIKELAVLITEDHRGKDLLLVGVLRGALVFMVDLARAIELPLSMDFMAVSSYGASTESSGVVRITKDLEMSIEGKHVLIVEDIIDSGLTLAYILEGLKARNPASLRVCALLDKEDRRKVALPVDYTGFVIPDEFVVGYGLDYRQRYRNLRCIAVLKPEAYL
ncbi:MAG: hypoxanthine phosphoribosyltransferase [Chloroflexi bacterium]|nr:hypoxanthine phosphoribosyltransferase [Chloroflexota bacterium]